MANWPTIVERDGSGVERFIDVTDCQRGIEILLKAGIIEPASEALKQTVREHDTVSTSPRASYGSPGEWVYSTYIVGKDVYVLGEGYTSHDVQESINQVRDHERRNHIRQRESVVADAISQLDR